MYVCNTVYVQMKKIKIKNLLCLSFHMLSSQNFFYLYSFFTWACSTGLALKFQEWATGICFYDPLKFPETESKHLWLLCHILCYGRFCISAPTPVALAAIYFLKRGLGLLFSFTLFYFIIIFHFHFYTFNTSKKIIEKFCKNYSTNDVLIECNFWLNKILAMYLIRKGVEINEKRAFNPTAKSTWTHAGATILTSTHTGPYSFKPAVVSR